MEPMKLDVFACGNTLTVECVALGNEYLRSAVQFSSLDSSLLET